MHEGHIRLYRKLKKSAFYNDSQYVHLWVHLLMSVNWAAKRVKLKDSDKFIDLLPGQVLTGRTVLSKETKINSSKIERILKALENEQQLEQQTFSKYRIITICNWHTYQQCEQQNEQQVNSKRTADEQQMNTKNKVNKVKNIKKESIGSENQFEICIAWKAYVEMRIHIKKPMTDYAMKLRVNDLRRLQSEGHDPILVLHQSIGNNWQDLFPLKTKDPVQAKTEYQPPQESDAIKEARRKVLAKYER
jgi:hypothetical protein